jgi:hypothetical protein
MSVRQHPDSVPVRSAHLELIPATVDRVLGYARVIVNGLRVEHAPSSEATVW